MAESLGDVIINLRSKDVNMTAGLRGVQDEIGKLSNRIFSVEGALHIAFGQAAARAIFHELHHAIKDFGEGFIEAQHHGESFAESLNEGVDKVFGLKSAYEQTTEAAKKFAETNEKVSKAVKTIDKITGHEEPSPYPNLPKGEGDTGTSNLDVMKAERDKIFTKLQDTIKESPNAHRSYLANFQKNVTGILGPLADQRDNDALEAAEKTDHETRMRSGRLDVTTLDEKIKKEEQRLKDLDQKKNHEGNVSALKDIAGAAGIPKSFLKLDPSLVGHLMVDSIQDTLFRDMRFGKAMFEKVTEGFAKEGKKATDDDKKKQQQEANERYRRNFEYHKRQGEKLTEQQKHDDESAKRIRDVTDPTAKLKDEFAEIQRLVGIGKLTPEEAAKAKQQDAKEFNAANQKENKVEFRSADVAANDMLKKSLEDADVQKEMRDLLQQITDNTKKPQPAVMT